MSNWEDGFSTHYAGRCPKCGANLMVVRSNKLISCTRCNYERYDRHGEFDSCWTANQAPLD